jgi:hypothetical protein
MSVLDEWGVHHELFGFIIPICRKNHIPRLIPTAIQPYDHMMRKPFAVTFRFNYSTILPYWVFKEDVYHLKEGVTSERFEFWANQT